MAKPITKHTVESLTAKAVEEGDCLIWQAYFGNGVPMVYSNGKMVSARGLLAMLSGREQPTTAGYWSSCCGDDACVKTEHTVFRRAREHYIKMGKSVSKTSEAMRRAKISAKRRKLTDEQISEIMHSNDSGPVLAARMGVSRSLVCKYRNGTSGLTRNTNIWSGLLA